MKPTIVAENVFPISESGPSVLLFAIFATNAVVVIAPAPPKLVNTKPVIFKRLARFISCFLLMQSHL